MVSTYIPTHEATWTLSGKTCLSFAPHSNMNPYSSGVSRASRKTTLHSDSVEIIGTSSVQYSSAPRRDRGGTQDCLWTRPVGRRALSLERWTRRGSTRVLSQCRQAFLSVVIRMYNLLNTTLSVTMFYNWHNSLENKKCKFWSHPLALGIHYITQSRTEQQAEQTALSCNVLLEQR